MVRMTPSAFVVAPAPAEIAPERHHKRCEPAKAYFVHRRLREPRPALPDTSRSSSAALRLPDWQFRAGCPPPIWQSGLRCRRHTIRRSSGAGLGLVPRVLADGDTRPVAAYSAMRPNPT